jgi:hypothetical protein
MRRVDADFGPGRFARSTRFDDFVEFIDDLDD